MGTKRLTPIEHVPGNAFQTQRSSRQRLRRLLEIRVLNGRCRISRIRPLLATTNGAITRRTSTLSTSVNRLPHPIFQPNRARGCIWLGDDQSLRQLLQLIYNFWVRGDIGSTALRILAKRERIEYVSWSLSDASGRAKNMGCIVPLRRLRDLV
ncbi:hypothetical protein FRC16_001649 [Serendipita sp. 398]|nr:hypothetical protein FRC16_001649 [Serendipita sp. 398]